jgi:acylphosphatase
MAFEETLRLRVTGKVQGVGYRFWATRTAANLGLRGSVRNRHDSSVEMLVTGASDGVAAMVEAARTGPAGTRVAQVAAMPDADDGSVGFTALPTE